MANGCGVAACGIQNRGKHRGIEPSTRISLGGGNRDLASIVEDIARGGGARQIICSEGNRETTLELDGGPNLPATKKSIGKPMPVGEKLFTFAKRKLVHSTQRD